MRRRDLTAVEWLNRTVVAADDCLESVDLHGRDFDGGFQDVPEDAFAAGGRCERSHVVVVAAVRRQ